MKKYTVSSVVKSQSSWIEKHYDHLKEAYLRRGLDNKILFTCYCLQMFEKNYLEFEQKKGEEQFEHQEQF